MLTHLVSTAFGYRLSPQFVQLLFRSYDRRGEQPQQQSAQAPPGAGFRQYCTSNES